MRRFLISMLAVLALCLPMQVRAQSGDATWLNNLDGLELVIGRSWMAPLVFEEEKTTTDFNDAGTPVSSVTTRSGPESTPVVTDAMRTATLSALVYQFDSADSAASGLEMLNTDQMDQLQRDTRSPATNEFSPEGLGDLAYGHEGVYQAEGVMGAQSEFAVVMLLVQQDNVVYQVFGQFVPGNHTDIATQVVVDMIGASIGDADPVFDMEGRSTGGLWEKLNGVNLAMPEGSTIFDLEIYPPADDAVMGNSVMVPLIDLNDLAAIPGLTNSWFISYAPLLFGTPAATPVIAETGVFSIELWVMEFSDSTHASAAAYAFNNTLIEPLGIVYTEGLGYSSDNAEGLRLVNTGFVRDKSLPEGDAATVIQAVGNTVYGARVYTRDLAPKPVAEKLITHLQGTSPGDSNAAESELVPSNDKWVYFPQVGDDVLYGLVPVDVRHEAPNLPPATPVG